MKRPDGHPDDTQLVARLYGDESPAVEQHLLRCHLCAARHQSLRSALDADRERLIRSADACFTPARLETQRAEVLARLETPRRGRALTFPASHEPAESSAGSTASWRLRWAAAVAAAAMVAVAGGGWLAEETRQARLAPAAADARSVAPAPRAITAEPSEAALAAIDMALARPGVAELRALDALTPRAPDLR